MPLVKADRRGPRPRGDRPGAGCCRFIPVQFNPTEYTLEKGAQIAEIAIPGLDSPILQFIRGQTEKLTLELFFDTTESGMDEVGRATSAR